MSSPFADLVGDLNDVLADTFGLAATYTPSGGGTATACTVLIDEADPARPEFSGKVHMAGKLITVRKSEIDAPAQGGTFLIGATRYTIVGAPLLDIATGALWACMVS